MSNQHVYQNFERIQSILNGEENVKKVLIHKNNSDDESNNYKQISLTQSSYMYMPSIQVTLEGFHYYFFISKFEKRPILHTFRSHINQWIKGDLKSEQSTYNLHYITVLTLWRQSSGYSVHPMMIAYIVFITS